MCNPVLCNNNHIRFLYEVQPYTQNLFNTVLLISLCLHNSSAIQQSGLANSQLVAVDFFVCLFADHQEHVKSGYVWKELQTEQLKIGLLEQKNTLFSCSKLFRTESWPQGKAEKNEFEKDGIFNYLKKGAASIYRSRLFSPKAKDTRNIILHCSPIAVGVTFVSAPSAIIWSPLPTCLAHPISEVVVRTVHRNVSEADSPTQLILPGSAGFCKSRDLKASLVMLTWNNGWTEKHCGLERKNIKMLDALSSQQGLY